MCYVKKCIISFVCKNITVFCWSWWHSLYILCSIIVYFLISKSILIVIIALFISLFFCLPCASRKFWGAESNSIPEHLMSGIHYWGISGEQSFDLHTKSCGYLTTLSLHYIFFTIHSNNNIFQWGKSQPFEKKWRHCEIICTNSEYWSI